MEVHFSSQTCKWATPEWLFNELNQEFNFDIDACALPDNAKCEKYFTPDDDGLLMPWSGSVWCNPPYGNKIADWVHKAWRESHNGCTVVCLLPSRTDTRWFHNYILGVAEIRFIKGRLKFGGSENNAPFPSMICIYRPPAFSSKMNEDE